MSDPSIFTLNDNIVVVGDYWWVTDSSRGMQITQNHNLFQLLNSTTQLGFDSDGLGIQYDLNNLVEDVLADPLFSDTEYYHLSSDSPAIDAASSDSYPKDFDGNPVPCLNSPG